MKKFFIHLKTGNTYEYLLTANENSRKDTFPTQAVYKSVETGEVYARPLIEFQEKFQECSHNPYVCPYKKGDMFTLQKPSCVSIKAGTLVEVLNTEYFPALDITFLTVKDLENFTLNFKGNREDIVETFKWA